MLLLMVIGVPAVCWLLLPKPPLLDGITFSRILNDNSQNLLFTSLSPDQKYRIYVPLNNIATVLTHATLVQEDRYYDFHPGINPVAVARSLWQLISRRAIHSGASTISMQVARLRFHLKTRTFGGKLHQMLIALELERHYTKFQILEAYLNLAPYGGNIEGIEAASQIYFAKPASQLTLPEAAALSVIPQSPARRALRLNAPSPSQTAAQTRLLIKLAAPAATLDFRAIRETTRPFLAPHFTRQVLRSAPAGANITTTLDLDLQRILEQRIKSYIAARSTLGVSNAAALLVDTHGMQVRAQVGSADFFNQTIDGQVDITASPRSPGSTLKPFIYALALEQGLVHPLSILEDAPRSFAGYNPENFDHEFVGPIRAADALARSRNIPAVTLASELARPTLYEFLRQSGIDLPHDESFYGLALPLGGAELTMQDLVKLYGALANNGLLLPLQYNLAAAPPPARRILTPESSFLVLDMLRTPPPGFALSSPYEAVSWKTGTSAAYRDAWSIAVFDHYILAVWIGNADGRGNPSFIGRTCAAPLLFQIIDTLHAAGYARLAPRLPPPGANLKRVDFCAISGALATPLCEHRIQGWFIPGISPISTCEVHRQVLIDTATGMRIPTDDGLHQIRRETYEFWPSDLLKLFREAGLARRTPPPYLPGTQPDAATWQQGQPPRILSPRPGAVYALNPATADQVPLQARTETGVEQIYWFADKQFIGKSTPRDPLPWAPAPGTHSLTAVDDAGRADTEKVVIETRIQ
jgi:penicillin-binding protein 1C